jgi:hypothetical protein
MALLLSKYELFTRGYNDIESTEEFKTSDGFAGPTVGRPNADPFITATNVSFIPLTRSSDEELKKSRLLLIGTIGDPPMLLEDESRFLGMVRVAGDPGGVSNTASAI